MVLTSFIAHGGEPHDLHDLLTTWGWEPFTWAGLIISAALYVVGVLRVWRAAGRVGAGVDGPVKFGAADR